MEETDDVNRDALAADVGAHIPATEASFEEEANFEEEEEEASRANSPEIVCTGDSDEEGEVAIQNPTDIEDLRGASDITIRHRFRKSIRSFQRFCIVVGVDASIVAKKANGTDENITSDAVAGIFTGINAEILADTIVRASIDNALDALASKYVFRPPSSLLWYYEDDYLNPSTTEIGKKWHYWEISQ